MATCIEWIWNLDLYSSQNHLTKLTTMQQIFFSTTAFSVLTSGIAAITILWCFHFPGYSVTQANFTWWCWICTLYLMWAIDLRRLNLAFLIYKLRTIITEDAMTFESSLLCYWVLSLLTILKALCFMCDQADSWHKLIQLATLLKALHYVAHKYIFWKIGFS